MSSKEKKLTFKGLCQKKDHLFKIDGMDEPVLIDKIKDGKVYFYAESDQHRQKLGNFDVEYFLGIVREHFKPGPKPAPADTPITLEMITKGFRYRLAIDAPDYEVTKITKSAITVAYVKDLADPDRRKEPGIYETFRPAEFLQIINEANAKVAAESKKAPGVKKPSATLTVLPETATPADSRPRVCKKSSRRKRKRKAISPRRSAARSKSSRPGSRS